METELSIKLEGLQLELLEAFDGEFAVLRGDDSLCVRDEDLGPLAYITVEDDEDGDDIAVVVYAEVAPPHIAAAIAVTLDQILPVFVECEYLFTATKVERNAL